MWFRFTRQNSLHLVLGEKTLGLVSDHQHVVVAIGEAFEPVPGLAVEIFSVPGKVPLFMETGEVDVGENQIVTVLMEKSRKVRYGMRKVWLS